MKPEIVALTRALAFAAEAHANQRRKGAAQEPYINHLIEVADSVAGATDGDDLELLIAALLHDVVEDTSVSAVELAAAFGPRVADIVQDNSDDMSLPKDQRRQQRIAAMARKSPDARMVKTADVISNLRAIVSSPPAGWGPDRKLGYLDGCRQLIDAGRGANARLEATFDETAAAVEQAVRAEASSEVEGRRSAVRQLESAIGQAVHFIYLANTSRTAIPDAEIDRLCTLLSTTFPSVTVQSADAVFDGHRRQVLLARIRTDSTEAIVAAAQRLCIDFDQQFVGIEVGGRYIRVYADDTG